MKKYLPYILILVILVGIFSLVPSAYASPENPSEACNNKDNPTNKPCVQPYVLLAPLPGADGQQISDVNPGAGLGTYLNLMIKIFIGLCAVLSVVMIVVGGLEYMTSELSHSKEAGKEKIRDAIFGLLIALGAYALLFTINPDLLKSDINPPPITVTPTPAPTPSGYAPSALAGACSDIKYITQNDCESHSATWTLPTSAQNGVLGNCDYYYNAQSNNTRTIVRNVTETYCYNTLKGISWTKIPS